MDDNNSRQTSPGSRSDVEFHDTNDEQAPSVATHGEQAPSVATQGEQAPYGATQGEQARGARHMRFVSRRKATGKNARNSNLVDISLSQLRKDGRRAMRSMRRSLTRSGLVRRMAGNHIMRELYEMYQNNEPITPEDTKGRRNQWMVGSLNYFIEDYVSSGNEVSDRINHLALMEKHMRARLDKRLYYLIMQRFEKPDSGFAKILELVDRHVWKPLLGMLFKRFNGDNLGDEYELEVDMPAQQGPGGNPANAGDAGDDNKPRVKRYFSDICFLSGDDAKLFFESDLFRHLYEDIYHNGGDLEVRDFRNNYSLRSSVEYGSRAKTAHHVARCVMNKILHLAYTSAYNPARLRKSLRVLAMLCMSDETNVGALCLACATYASKLNTNPAEGLTLRDGYVVGDPIYEITN